MQEHCLKNLDNSPVFIPF